jgi:hypothetical protein
MVGAMLARLLPVVIVAVSLDAAATDIYKCTGAGATSYQETPCARGQNEVPLRLAGGSPQAAAQTATTYASPQPGKRGVWTRTSIELGMSDDEVLNLPGWGRPLEIARSRLARGWQEVWRYGDRYSGSRELRFVNARLADIADAPAALAWAPR